MPITIEDLDEELTSRQQSPEQPSSDALDTSIDLELGERSGGINIFKAGAETIGRGFEAVKGMVKGQIDPAFADVPGFTGEGILDVETAARLNRARVVGVTDPVYEKLVMEALGPTRLRKVEQDKFGLAGEPGHTIITYQDDRGDIRREYINKPGLDVQDVERGLESSLPFLATGGPTSAAVKGLGLTGRALFQALGQGAASAAQDIGADEQIDPTKAGIAAIGGIVGETLLPVGRGIVAMFRNTPGLVDRETRALTVQGIAAVERAGLDPLDLPVELLDELLAVDAAATAGTPAAAEAVARAEADQFGIPTSRGSRTKDPAVLSFEEEARQNLIGQGAAKVVRDFDKDVRAGAVAAIDEQATRLSPNVEQIPQTLGEAGESLQQGLRTQSDVADKQISQAFDAVDVKAIFPQGIPREKFKQLGERVVHELGDQIDNLAELPNARAMAQLLDDYSKGRLRRPDIPLLQQPKRQPRTFDSIRRSINTTLTETKRGSPDERAVLSIKRAYNDWLENLAQGALEGADLEAFSKLKTAIGFTAQSKKLFKTQSKNDAGGKILEKIRVGTDSPEGAINALIPGSFKSAPKEGAVNAASRLKTILEKEQPEAWQAIRAAYWLKLSRGDNLFKQGPIQRGELDTALGQVARNIEGMFAKHNSLIKVLFSPEELTRIKSFGSAARRAQSINPNPSGTAFVSKRLYAAARDNILPNIMRRKAASAQLATESVAAAFWRTMVKRAVSILGARGEGIAARAVGKRVSRELPKPRTTGGGGLGAAINVQAQTGGPEERGPSLLDRGQDALRGLLGP